MRDTAYIKNQALKFYEPDTDDPYEIQKYNIYEREFNENKYDRQLDVICFKISKT